MTMIKTGLGSIIGEAIASVAIPATAGVGTKIINPRQGKLFREWS